jgi:hypothetical protein
VRLQFGRPIACRASTSSPNPGAKRIPLVHFRFCSVAFMSAGVNGHR